MAITATPRPVLIPAKLLVFGLLWLVLPSQALADQFGLAASVLPGSRSATVGSPVTVYASIANASEINATDCTIQPVTVIPADFSYQATDPATNIPIGSPDTPVDIAAGGSQSFIIVLTATSEFGPTDVEFEFTCTGFFPAQTRLGLNTLFTSASSTPVPDVFARARTLDNNGIVHIPEASAGTGIFAVAATNAGSVAGDFLVFGYSPNGFGVPLQVFVCESDPATGLCLSPPADTVTTAMPAGSNRTFSAFVQATGRIDTYFRPDSDRIVIAFLDFDAGIIRSQTSVAVQFVPPAMPVASILPTSRSVQVGNTATAFATIVNAGSTTATDCGITPLTSVAADFSFQTTDPVTNQLTGTPNTPVTVSAGELQTFSFSFTPTAPFNPTEIQLGFDCSNSPIAPVVTGLNTFLLSASGTPVPDIIAVATTPTTDGIMNLPGPTATSSFAAAAVNAGSDDTITVSVDTGGASLPLQLLICEMVTGTDVCVNPPAASVAVLITSGGAPTSFAVFVTALGDVPFDPAANRISVIFSDSTGVVRGATGVAVTTYNDNFANAIPLTGDSGTTTASNVEATVEPGEPNNAGIFGGKSLWWRWSPLSGGSITFDTFGSNFDTTLGVYTGTRVDALTHIASNDDSGGAQSRVTFDAVPGTEYYISVDGFFGASGTIVLNRAP